MQTWAAIFDWDGVILDSAGHHEQAWEWLAAQRGQKLPEGFFLKSFGMKNEEAIEKLLGWKVSPAEMRRLIDAKEDFYRGLLVSSGGKVFPSVREWLTTLKTRGVPCAIASSTPRANIEVGLKVLQLDCSWDAIVTAEDVTHGKPNPEVFLIAARRLNTPPARCVVFEDAPVGIQAGLAAGMKVVAVPTTNPKSSLTAAHRMVEQLDELTVPEVDAWFTPPEA